MAKTQRGSSTPGGATSWLQTEQLETVGDIRRFLGFLIHQVRRNKITVKKANCLGQLANTLINAIVDHELEQRIAQMEADRTVGWQPAPHRDMTMRTGGSA